MDVSTCDYLMDSDFPLRHVSHVSSLEDHEPRYALDEETWDKVVCYPFLDAANSGKLSRLIWFPTSLWSKNYGSKNQFGEYCILRHKERAAARESKVWTSPQ